jgi:hypothetical protein
MHERDENISVWFNQKKEEIEQSYLVCSDKYMQSGWSSTPERWMRARRVILNAQEPFLTSVVRMDCYWNALCAGQVKMGCN